MAELLHFEDFAVGQVIDLGTYAVTAAEIREFASEFDPQPFHLDEAAGKASILGGLAASGWHVCSMLMRMIADSWLNKSASMGSNGVSEVKWLKPVLAGETLSGTGDHCCPSGFPPSARKWAFLNACLSSSMKRA